MIFGYANGTDEEIDILPFLFDHEGYDNNNNLVNILLEKLVIENNIYGYEKIYKIKLINIPDEIKFIKLGVNEQELHNGDILETNYTLIQNKELIKHNNFYFLDFQYIIKEPECSLFYSNAELTLGDAGDFCGYFIPNTFYGRTNTLKFKLCHSYCNTCSELSISNNDQKCLSCLPEYQYDYFNKSKTNCVPEGFYYDTELKQLIECNSEDFEFNFDENNNKTYCYPLKTQEDENEYE